MTGEKRRRFGAGLKSWLVRGVASLLIGPTAATTLAQTPAPPPAYETSPSAAPAPEAQMKKFTQAELEQLLAPIALYPDALLAQLLPAAAYPLEIVQAHRWLERNSAAVANQDFSGADAQNWDPSVKAMVRFPTVLEKMNDELDWTRNLGDAIVNQPQEVADAIQLLRLKAQQAGALELSNQLNVVTRKEGARDVIFIESPDPSVIYLPRYDPVAVFAPSAGVAIAAGLMSFGVGVAVGSAWRGNYWNWNTGVFYPPVWPGYPAWRPPYAGWRPGMPGGAGNNISVGGGGGNNISIGGGGNNVIGGRPWRLDPDRRPGGRPGAGGPIGRPGPGGGNGGVRPPGGGPGGGGQVNRPGPGGGSGGVRPPGGGAGGGGQINRPGPGGGNGGVRPPGGGAGGGGQINRPGPGGGARPGGGAGGPIALPGQAGRPVGSVGGLPRQQPGGFPGRPAPGARPGIQGGGGHGRPAHPGLHGGGGRAHHGGFGGGHGGGGRAHHGGRRR